MRVEVYRNLHKHCFSVRHKGLVIRRSQLVVIDDAKFAVQEGGRQRVLKEKRKNVHAFVRGQICDSDPPIPKKVSRVSYNPYKAGYFVDEDENKIVEAKRVWLYMENGKSNIVFET